jgi:hypothetical protein
VVGGARTHPSVIRFLADLLRFGSKSGVFSSIVALSRRIEASSALNNINRKFGLSYLDVSSYFRPLVWQHSWLLNTYSYLIFICLCFVKVPGDYFSVVAGTHV